MFTGKKFFKLTIYVFILVFLSSYAYAAKSVYVINDTQTSNLKAYKIEGFSLIYQTDYTCFWDPEGLIGAIGVKIDESRYGKFLFVTFEESDVIELINAMTMQFVDSIVAPGATDLAGVEMDSINSKLYAVDRYTNNLYSWTWNPETMNLTPDFDEPFYVGLQDCLDAFGIALDEENGLLYVADNTDSIKYYNTNDWSKEGEISVYCYVISIAIDVPNQLLYYGSMGAYGEGDNHLYKYNLSTHTESSVNVGTSVAGIAVDQQTSLVYITTFGGQDDIYYPNLPQDRLMIYNSNLVKQSFESGDIGNPAGLTVAEDVAYKLEGFSIVKEKIQVLS